MRTLYYVLGVRLVDEVPMLERHRKQAGEWLKQWTPENNFKGVITDNPTKAVEYFRKEMARVAAQHNYPAENFELNVFCTQTEVVDGLEVFWHNASSAARLYCQVNVGTGVSS